MKTFPKGGIHPAECKITAGSPIIDIPAPTDEIVLLLSQHIGAPAKPVVKKGDHVDRYAMVAEAGGFVSAPVHTPLSGTVAKIDKVRNAAGVMADAIFIKPDEQQPAEQTSGPVIHPDEPQAIIDAIGNAGIVGLGGATFPAKVKLSPPPGSTAEVLIINAAECEPWLTNDDALMRAEPDAIIEGVRLLMIAAKVNRALIGVEANKPEAIAALIKAAAKVPGIEVVPLKTKYPQGGEKQLIKALTGREVPSGALPIAVGAIVQNVATAYAVERALHHGIPCVERVMTVTGPNVARPGNYRVVIGTPLRTVLEAAGGLPEDTGKVILGGPMMGRTAACLDSPVTKGTSAMLILPREQSARGEVQPCIRCARCVTVCPMGLEPFLISTLARLDRDEEAEHEAILDCIECGSCSYTCPSWRPLLDYIRLGKGRILAARRKAAQKK